MIPLRYVLARIRSKGALNLVSSALRTRCGSRGVRWLARLAHIVHMLNSTPRLRIISIETQSGCNYRCAFCPVGKVPLPSGQMSLELFESLASQLSAFTGEIHLFFRNEPLLDQRLERMVDIVRARTAATIVIQTNGSKLTPGMALRLARKARVIVNDYTSGGAVASRLRLAGVHRQVIVVPRYQSERLTNRAGNVPGLPSGRGAGFCVKPFSELVITFSGKAVLCCQDWREETIVGDATRERLDDIWQGRALATIRQQLEAGQRSGLCEKCDFPGV